MAVTDLNLDGARDVAGEIDGGAYELDVRSAGSIAAAVEAAEAELGPVDVLVNNAGYDEWAFFTHTNEELWRRVLGRQPGRGDRGDPRRARGCRSAVAGGS